MYNLFRTAAPAPPTPSTFVARIFPRDAPLRNNEILALSQSEPAVVVADPVLINALNAEFNDVQGETRKEVDDFVNSGYRLDESRFLTDNMRQHVADARARAAYDAKRYTAPEDQSIIEEYHAGEDWLVSYAMNELARRIAERDATIRGTSAPSAPAVNAPATPVNAPAPSAGRRRAPFARPGGSIQSPADYPTPSTYAPPPQPSSSAPSPADDASASAYAPVAQPPPPTGTNNPSWNEVTSSWDLRKRASPSSLLLAPPPTRAAPVPPPTAPPLPPTSGAPGGDIASWTLRQNLARLKQQEAEVQRQQLELEKKADQVANGEFTQHIKDTKRRQVTIKAQIVKLNSEYDQNKTNIKELQKRQTKVIKRLNEISALRKSLKKEEEGEAVGGGAVARTKSAVRRGYDALTAPSEARYGPWYKDKSFGIGAGMALLSLIGVIAASLSLLSDQPARAVKNKSAKQRAETQRKIMYALLGLAICAFIGSTTFCIVRRTRKIKKEDADA